MRDPEARPAGSGSLTLVLLVLLAVGIPFLLRLELVRTRGFNPDEFEHVHFAYEVAQGRVPYRDYFDHHTPWLHFLLAGLFPWYDATRVPEQAWGLLFAARRLMWVFAAAILGLTFALGRRAWGSREALVGVLLLSNAGYFLRKSLEIRPDVPAAALLLASVWLWAAAERAGRRRLLLASAGASLAAGILFTQKVLFAGPAVAFVWLVVVLRRGRPLGARVADLGSFSGGFAAPFVATLAWFWARGALGDFVRYNFLLNVDWPGLGPRDFLVELLREDPGLVLAAATGLALALWAATRRSTRPESAEGLIGLQALSLLAGLLVLPAVTYHYFLLPLPFMALLAGRVLVRAASMVPAFLARRPRGVTILAVGLLVVPGAAAAALEVPGWRAPGLQIGALGLLAVPALAPRLREGWALVLVLAAWTVHPALRLRADLDRGNWSTLQGIQYVLTNTAPWETVLDGYTGLGVFRPAPFFHAFLYSDIYAVETDAERRDVVDALRSGKALPKLVFYNHYLEGGVLPEASAFLRRHYVPTGLDPILIRPFDNGLGFWSDEGLRYFGWVKGTERSPHLIFDQGWRPPDQEGGIAVRRSRTARSRLIVPIRRPRDYTITLRALAHTDEGPFSLELVVNGVSAGAHPAVPRWQEYDYRIDARHLIPGFNVFELRYLPRDPGAEYRREVSFYSLKLAAVPLRRADPGGVSRPAGPSPGAAAGSGGRSGSRRDAGRP